MNDPAQEAPHSPAGRWRGFLGRGPRWRRYGAVVAGCVVLGIAPWVWVHWEARGHVYAAVAAPKAPVALVLGAGLTASGRPSPFLAGRLEVAKELYDTGRVRVILVSGDNRYTTYDEPTAMRDWLVERGIPDAAIVRDFAGRDTYDSCVRAQRIFGVTRALVVSQAYHVPRAVAICHSIGMDVDGVGDSSVTGYAAWQTGQIREIPAAGKAVWDVVSGRDPVLGAPETSVTDALARTAAP